MSTLRTVAATTLLAAALVAPVVAAGPALAQGGHPRVQAGGTCSETGSWKLKAKADDPSLVKIEFEVDTDVVGQTFAVRLTDGTAVVFDGTATTAGASGSFTVKRSTADQAGRDVVRAVATRGTNTCSGVVRL